MVSFTLLINHSNNDYISVQSLKKSRTSLNNLNRVTDGILWNYSSEELVYSDGLGDAEDWADMDKIYAHSNTFRDLIEK